MLVVLGLILLAAAFAGLVLSFLQIGALLRHCAESPRQPSSCPKVSILKPLCGIDDGLAESLELFAALDYPAYELLLGVETASDPAFPLAKELEARHPARVRVVVQRGAPGLNPKVNQLIGLQAASSGEIVVISDSNARAEPRFLREIAAWLEDPEIGLVAHPVVGTGERSLGAALDNLHISTMGLGVVGAKRVSGMDFAIGKTMSLRRRDLERLGGFAAVKDVLAEDFVLCRWTSEKLGLKMAMARTPIESVATRRTVGQFYARYARWAVMHRMAVSKPTYLGELLLNPVLLALLGFLAWPTRWTFLAAAALVVVRTAIDQLATRLMRGRGFRLRHLAFSPFKDLLIGAAWLHGATHDRVLWRGHPLAVRSGTLLVRLGQGEPLPESEPLDESSLPAAAGSPRHG